MTAGCAGSGPARLCVPEIRGSPRAGRGAQCPGRGGRLSAASPGLGLPLRLMRSHVGKLAPCARVCVPARGGSARSAPPPLTSPHNFRSRPPLSRRRYLPGTSSKGAPRWGRSVTHCGVRDGGGGRGEGSDRSRPPIHPRVQCLLWGRGRSVLSGGAARSLAVHPPPLTASLPPPSPPLPSAPPAAFPRARCGPGRRLRAVGCGAHREPAGEIAVRAGGVRTEPVPQPTQPLRQAAAAAALPAHRFLLRHRAALLRPLGR